MPKRWAAGKKKIRRPESLLCKESVLKNVTLGVGGSYQSSNSGKFPTTAGQLWLEMVLSTVQNKEVKAKRCCKPCTAEQ